MTLKQTLIDRIETYLRSYVVMADDSYFLPTALWIAATHTWDSFDAFGYVCITSLTKQSGKTTLANLIEFSCHEPHQITAMTPAAMFHCIEEKKPVIICDESEVLNSESATFLRAALNAGYRRGSKVERIGEGGKIVEYQVYCPKVFVLIGDVYDTLRDRSIIVRMKRGRPVKRFVYKAAKSEGHDLRAEAVETMKEHKDEIEKMYHDFKGLIFLPGRDEEIWTPLFVLASMLCPKRMEELTRCAVDIATEKTHETNKSKNLAAENAAESDHFQVLLLRNILEIAPQLTQDARGDTKPRKDSRGSKRKQEKAILRPDAVLEALKQMTTGPWRKYRAAGTLLQRDGLSRDQMADLLARLGVKTIPWRVDSKPVRVYDLEALKAKALEIGITQKGDE